MPNYKDKECLECGSVFKPTSPKQKCCGKKECKAAVRRKSEKARYHENKKVYNKSCKVCGALFSTSDSRKIYCDSKECDTKRKDRNNAKSSLNRSLRSSKNKEDKLSTIKESFASAGYTLLSSDYISGHSKLKYKCDKGHINKISWSNFRRGKRCPDCYGNKRYTLEQVKEKFAEFGYTVLSEHYENGLQDLDYICPNGHKGSMRWNNFQQGKRCVECQGIRRIDIDLVRYLFEREGYTLLTTEYKNNEQKLEYICPEGHSNVTTLGNFDNAGKRCPDCAGNKKYTLEYVKECFSNEGYTLTSTEYTNNKTPLSYICPKGHEGQIGFDNFYNKGKRCYKCFGAGSKAEKEIYEFVCNLIGYDNVISNDRSLIKPLELDIYVPSKNLAIEYCGLYFHSEVSGDKPRSYHYDKMKACNDKDVRLITIFEDEYIERPEQVLSRVQNALGVGLRRIYARKCEVKELLNREDLSFLQQHHLQGKTGGSARWGLYYEGELVSVMSVGRMSRTHTAKLRGCPDAKLLELKRFAHKTGCTVIGGASRLFKQVKKYAKENGFTHVKSYCDMRYGNHRNAVYEQLGFELLTYTKYTPHYVKDGKRYRNQGLRKTPEERLTGKTEWELRKEEGFDRIFDSGHRTYIYEL